MNTIDIAKTDEVLDRPLERTPGQRPKPAVERRSQPSQPAPPHARHLEPRPAEMSLAELQADARERIAIDTIQRPGQRLTSALILALLCSAICLALFGLLQSQRAPASIPVSEEIPVAESQISPNADNTSVDAPPPAILVQPSE